MTQFYAVTIHRVIKIQGPIPDPPPGFSSIQEWLESETAVTYPVKCKETDGSVEVSVEED